MDRDEMSTFNRRPPIDASYQVSVHLAKWFQRRKFKKSANQKQEWPVATMFVNGSGRNEQYLQRIFHRCFLPSFGTFRQAVSEKIFKNQQYLYRDNCILNTDIYIKTSVIFLLTEIFWKSTNQKQELPVAAMLVNRSGQNEQFFIEDLRRMLPTKFRFIWPSGFRGEDFLEINQSETRMACGGHVCQQIGTK
jgi:hypothetical protein